MARRSSAQIEVDLIRARAADGGAVLRELFKVQAAFEVLLPWTRPDESKAKQPANAIRSSDDAWRVEVPAELIECVKARWEAGKLQNSERHPDSWVRKYFENVRNFLSQWNHQGVGKPESLDYRLACLLCSATVGVLTQNPYGRFKIKYHDEWVSVQVEEKKRFWPKSADYTVGKRVYGKVSQEVSDSFVVVSRTSTGSDGKDSHGPASTREGIVELLSRLSGAGISITGCTCRPKNLPASDVPSFALKASSAKQEVVRAALQISEHMSSKLNVPSEDSAFEIIVDSIEFDRVRSTLVGDSPPKRAAVLDWLTAGQNIVLEGVPGTGKTHAVNSLAGTLQTVSGRSLELTEDSVLFMTLHPSTSYEDFVEGLRPTGNWVNSTSVNPVSPDGDDVWFHLEEGDRSESSSTFAIKNGFFVDACVQAVDNPDLAIVVVLDELNRCNIPKVLGDLLTVIEESKRAQWDGSAWVVDRAAKAVTLPYSGRKLFVPDNLFIIGTMNTTDRSVAPMDAALRRRFSFHRIWPDGFSAFTPNPGLKDLTEELGEPAIAPHTELWLALNHVLFAKFGADAMLGHSYLYDLRSALARDSKSAPHHWDHRILPQLMDVIESNGLTRLLVKDAAKFFDSETALPGSDLITTHIKVTFSGEGSLKRPHLRYQG